MEILAIINKCLDLKIVQWSLLLLCVCYTIYTPIRINYLKYDNAMLKSTVADVSSALYFQNEKVKELGAKTDELKTNYQQATKRATQVALEGQKTLQALMANQLVGTCEDKVKQVGELARKAIGN